MGLMILRVGLGLMMLSQHGLPKLLAFKEKMGTFADPLGLGSTTSLTLAVLAELLCSAFVVLGIATRLSAIPPFLTMMVATFIVHVGDPWTRKELAMLYAIGFLTLILTGGGRFQVGTAFGGPFERYS